MTVKDNESHWFIGFVKPCQEKKTAELLARFGYRYYLPIQKVRRKWSDRYKIVDVLVIPRMIFLYCTEKERIQSLKDIPMLYAFMMDRGEKCPATVRYSEMDNFRFMVDHGEDKEVSVEQTAAISPGDKVRIIRGPMTGLECEFLSGDGNEGLAVVRLGILGAATINVSADDLQKL